MKIQYSVLLMLLIGFIVGVIIERFPYVYFTIAIAFLLYYYSPKKEGPF